MTVIEIAVGVFVGNAFATVVATLVKMWMSRRAIAQAKALIAQQREANRTGASKIRAMD